MRKHDSLPLRTSPARPRPGCAGISCEGININPAVENPCSGIRSKLVPDKRILCHLHYLKITIKQTINRIFEQFCLNVFYIIKVYSNLILRFLYPEPVKIDIASGCLCCIVEQSKAVTHKMRHRIFHLKLCTYRRSIFYHQDCRRNEQYRFYP